MSKKHGRDRRCFLPILKDFELTPWGRQNELSGAPKRPRSRWMLPSILATPEVLYWMPVVRLWGWWGDWWPSEKLQMIFSLRWDEPEPISRLKSAGAGLCALLL